MGLPNAIAKKIVVYARKVSTRFRALDREAVAGYYLKGEGLEIGALHNPLLIPASVSVRYVDRMTVADLRTQYPELIKERLTEPDILDDGEQLSTVQDSSQDFLIANHFLEHCENPIQTIKNFLRVLKIGGILYMCIPDKRFTFDRDRPVTPFDHLERDYREGPEWSRRQHFEEWVLLMEKVSPPEKARARTDELMAMRYSIHFHVWTQSELMEFIRRLQADFHLGIEVELFLKLGGEVLLVLRKSSTT